MKVKIINVKAQLKIDFLLKEINVVRRIIRRQIIVGSRNHK